MRALDGHHGIDGSGGHNLQRSIRVFPEAKLPEKLVGGFISVGPLTKLEMSLI